MIKIDLYTNAGRKTQPIFVPGSTTIREVLDQEHVNYAVAGTLLDGCTLKPGDMDKTFDDFGIEEQCSISCLVKQDNAAKVAIAGNAAVVTSALKLADIKTASKYRPKALQLFEDKEQVYQIAAVNAPMGGLSKHGAEFSDVTNADGYATITIAMDSPDADKFIEEYGQSIVKLNKVEEGFGAYLDEINAEQAKIKESIAVL